MTGTQIPYLVAVADDDPEKRLTRLLEEGLNVVFPRPGGVEDHETPFLVFFDSAAVATKGWLTPMVDLASRNSRAAVIDCKHVASDGSLWGAGGAMSSSGLSRAYGRGDDPDKPEYSYVREVDCVLGGCFLTTRTAIAAVGGFDNGFATGRYRDLDFAFAVRQTGRSVLYQPESTVRIFSPTPENGAREPDAPADRERFCKRWAEALGSQPDHELNAVV
jgi:hypothetical protein